MYIFVLATKYIMFTFVTNTQWLLVRIDINGFSIIRDAGRACIGYHIDI